MVNIIIIPFIILHWYMNNNKCILTLAENTFRKNSYNDNEQDGFIDKLILPIYDFNKNHIDMSLILYLIMFLALIGSSSHLFYNYKIGKFNGVKDLYDL